MGEPGTELVEEVDIDGRVLGVVTRAEMRSSRLRHRATFIAVVDRHRRLLVHRRSDLKDVWPSLWDIAAGGVAAVGETWEEGARRELAEELDIDAPLTDLGRDTYEDDEVKTVTATFVAHHDGPYRFADGEVAEARWVTLVELRRMLDAMPFCPDSIAVVLPRILPFLEPRDD